MLATERKYLDTAEVAKLISKRLAAVFPATRFQVRISRYSGGSSVDIRWTDGPRAKSVAKEVEPYEGNGFDGSIDLQYSKDTWLLPDGSAVRAAIESTNGSRGSVSGYVTDAPHPNAVLVRTTCWIHTNRHLTEEQAQVADAEAYIKAHCKIDHYDYGDKFGNDWTSQLAIKMAYDRAGEDYGWENPFRRVVLREEV